MVAKDERPAFVLVAPANRPYLVVSHGRHDLLRRLFAAYDAAPLPEGGRLADLLAWGATFVCRECGPICPMCGRPAELSVLFGMKAGWTHRTTEAEVARHERLRETGGAL